MILILDFIQICSIAQAFLEYSLGFLFGFTLWVDYYAFLRLFFELLVLFFDV